MFMFHFNGNENNLFLINFFYLCTFQNVMYSCDGKAEFSAEETLLIIINLENSCAA